MGLDVGLFVSPGRVGRLVTGAMLGIDEGADEVGLEVGAWMIEERPETIKALRKLCTEARVTSDCTLFSMIVLLRAAAKEESVKVAFSNCVSTASALAI